MTRKTKQTKFTERPAKIHLDGWAGHRKQAVIVVGETPKRYRVRPAGDTPVQVAGRRRWLHSNQTTLVPKDAVTFDDGCELAALAKRWAAWHPSNEWTRRDDYGELHDPSVWTTEGWEPVERLNNHERETLFSLHLAERLCEEASKA
jgi:hypothetical protein